MDRLLRTYSSVAHKDHWCDRCCSYIQPGEMYEGMVYASNRSGIITLKFHPACESPEDPDNEENCLEKVVADEFRMAA